MFLDISFSHLKKKNSFGHLKFDLKINKPNQSVNKKGESEKAALVILPAMCN